MRDHLQLFLGGALQWGLATAFTRYAVLDGNLAVFLSVFAGQTLWWVNIQHTTPVQPHLTMVHVVCRSGHRICHRKGSLMMTMPEFLVHVLKTVRHHPMTGRIPLQEMTWTEIHLYDKEKLSVQVMSVAKQNLTHDYVQPVAFNLATSIYSGRFIAVVGSIDPSSPLFHHTTHDHLTRISLSIVEERAIYSIGYVGVRL